MAIDFRVEAVRGNLERAMRGETIAIRRGTRDAVKEQTRELQLSIRREVNQVFDGPTRRKVGNSIRSRVYENDDGSFAGLIWSKFGRREGGRFVDYLLPYVEGATIRPEKAGGRLYIPFSRGRGKGARRGPRIDVENDPRVYWQPSSKPGVTYLVRSTKSRTTLIAVLVKQVTVRPKIQVAGLVAKSEADFPRTLLRNLEENDRDRS